MSDFYTPATTPVARKAHRCTYCAGPIPVGEKHHKQTGNHDGAWFKNRFHDECWDTLCEEPGGFEFCPGDGEMPERVRLLVKQGKTP